MVDNLEDGVSKRLLNVCTYTTLYTASYLKIRNFSFPNVLQIYVRILVKSRSQWPRGLRRTSAAARLLRSWVRIPPGAWMFVCCECCVLSGRGLCDELITRPEESYRLWCFVVCDLETSRICAPYIYDIRSLRVNDLTLILLTWRKWWANNASK